MHWPQAEKLSAFNVIQFDISSFHLGTTFSSDNNESKFTQKFSTSHCQNTWLIVFETYVSDVRGQKGKQEDKKEI